MRSRKYRSHQRPHQSIQLTSSILLDFHTIPKMIVERNVAIPADDGLKLCADIFRPDDEKSALVIIPKVPMEKASSTKTAIRINGTGFWRPIQTFFQVKPAKSFMTREAADPELWTKWGYVYIRIDSRGTGRTPEFLDIFSPREIKDFYDAIE